MLRARMALARSRRLGIADLLGQIKVGPEKGSHFPSGTLRGQ
jgi:hypothetical protein